MLSSGEIKLIYERFASAKNTSHAHRHTQAHAHFYVYLCIGVGIYYHCKLFLEDRPERIKWSLHSGPRLWLNFNLFFYFFLFPCFHFCPLSLSSVALLPSAVRRAISTKNCSKTVSPISKRGVQAWAVSRSQHSRVEQLRPRPPTVLLQFGSSSFNYLLKSGVSSVYSSALDCMAF